MTGSPASAACAGGELATGTLFEQVASAHLVSGRLAEGESVELSVDQVLTHDGLGPLVMLQFAQLGLDGFAVPNTVVYNDHNVVATDPRMARDHHFLRGASAAYGAHFARPGAGICHRVHLERFATPGAVLVGSDSHTPTCGAMGMLAVGAGGLAVTEVLATGTFRMPVPRLGRLFLTGALPDWVTAKDLALAVLARLGVTGGRGHVLEFAGPGVATMAMPQRATMANLCTELGATAAMFPSDERSREYLDSVGRGGEWRRLRPAVDAEYDWTVRLALPELVPLAARPGRPDDVVAVREPGDVAVAQVVVGSCNNGSYSDVRQVAEVLAGRRVHPDVELVIAPSSASATEALASEGWLAALLAAGATVAESSCAPCIGLSHLPRPGSVSVRTFNRNFPGRSGSPGDQVYLVSPLTAAATALTGRLTDPRTIGTGAAPECHLPPAPNQHAVLPPPEVGQRPLAPSKDADMHPVPELDPLPPDLELTVVGVFGDDVTTDDIIPARPEVMAAITDLPVMAEYTFVESDPGFVARAHAATAGIVFGGDNFGQGSSRENAALVLRQLGIRVVAARSFARIHRGNLISWGIAPMLLSGRAPECGDTVKVPDSFGLLTGSDTITLHTSRDITIRLGHDLSPREAETVLAGGRLGQLRRTVPARPAAESGVRR